MDFMKLFGTVIAVLFHPGSASKLNGKNLRRSGENSLKKKKKNYSSFISEVYEFCCFCFVFRRESFDNIWITRPWVAFVLLLMFKLTGLNQNRWKTCPRCVCVCYNHKQTAVKLTAQQHVIRWTNSFNMRKNYNLTPLTVLWRISRTKRYNNAANYRPNHNNSHNYGNIM